MAERRMFAKTIIDSDAFIEMPMSARLLYYDLGMRADDDGFVNSPKKIMRMIGASNDDMNILIMRKFIIPFESGVVVIKHWRINNYLRSDRYTETQYVKEKEQLTIDEKGKYHVGIPDGIPEVSTGKVSIGKDSIDNIYSKEYMTDSARSVNSFAGVVTAWNSLSDIGVASISKLSPGTQRYQWTASRLKTYGLDGLLKAIENVRHSSFLLSGKFNFTYDWFIRPNNFLKVYDGNYLDADFKPKAKSEPKQMVEIMNTPDGWTEEKWLASLEGD